MVQADRRLHPRVKVDLAVQIEISGDKSGARIVDISLGGVSIRGDQELARKLKPEPDQGQSQGAAHLVSFDLPGSYTGKHLSILSRLVHVRRQSQNDYVFGIKFISLEAGDAASLSDYIDSHFCELS